MTNTILLKRSDVANTVPLTENLIPGELALNFADGNLFFKDTSNNIVLLTSTQFVNVLGNVTGGNLNTGGSLTATGNVTGGNVTTATLTANTLVNATATTAATSTTTGAIRTAGGIGVAGNAHVGGALVAVTKSFAIEHPDKKDTILYHGCLEGPEHAVYVRGRCRGNFIQLPDYWPSLVDPDSITVHLTPMGHSSQPVIKHIHANSIELAESHMIDCFYLIHATRRDVPSLEIEVPGTIQDLYRNH